MIGNTDNHLKNFLMLHDETGWRLSPAFDLVPNIMICVADYSVCPWQN